MWRKLREWTVRYFWAEVFSTAFTFFFGWCSGLFTANPVIIAYAGTLGAAVGFYGVIFIRDIRKSFRDHSPDTAGNKALLIAGCLRNMGFEFGLAEVIDFFIVRPFFLFYGPVVLKNYFWGILAGKTVADIIFFAISILMYEIRKKHLHWF